MSTKTKPPEPNNSTDAVRNYLAYLANPESFRDEGAIRAAEKSVVAARDPIEKLRAIGLLEKARTRNVGAELEAAFVQHARSWADSEGLPPAVFTDASLGVKIPTAVLRRAGLAGGKESAPVAKRKSGASRAPRLSLDDVFSKLPTGRFSLGDAASAIERDNGTTRVYVVKLVTAGRIRKVGEDPEYDGRGRAPIVYEKPQ